MNSYIVQKDLRAFYLSRKLAGKSYRAYSLCHIFLAKNLYKNWIHKYFIYDHSKSEQVFIDNCTYLKNFYRVKDLYLIEKRKVKTFLEIATDVHYWYTNRICGTNLCVYYDDSNIPWWKYRKYGLNKSWLPEDIEEHHINKNIKDRDEILEYLKSLKKDPFATFRGFYE